MEYLPAKTIVNRTKNASWFGTEYNGSIYRAGLREKRLKSFGIPALLITRQTKRLLSNPHAPVSSVVP
ncbi:MAG: hypothetical protein HFF18_11020 [Oscillospiraceae bacterium]|nr:hypothetical protein [Oscillospiraceae bacterium]